MLKYRRSIRAYQTIKTKKANRKVYYLYTPFQTILRYTPTTNKLVNIEDKPRAHWNKCTRVPREILKVLGLVEIILICLIFYFFEFVLLYFNSFQLPLIYTTTTLQIYIKHA